jgi:hypothetical protein
MTALLDANSSANRLNGLDLADVVHPNGRCKTSRNTPTQTPQVSPLPIVGPPQPPPPSALAFPAAGVHGPTPEEKAAVLKESFFPASMMTALNLGAVIDDQTCSAYLRDFRQQMGEPKDPVENMILEHLAMAHVRVAQLHAEAGRAKEIEGVAIYNAAAARLLSEFRKLALALNTYRGERPSQPNDKEPPSEVKLSSPDAKPTPAGASSCG